MKHYLLFAFFLLTGWPVSAQWADTGPGGESLSAVSFADAATGWACGANGAVYQTRDGGTTWAFVPNFYNFLPRNHMLAVAALSPTRVLLLWQYASATQPAVVYYSDGAAFDPITAGNGYGDFNNLSGRQPTLALAVGNAGALRLSRDRGENWPWLKVWYRS